MDDGGFARRETAVRFAEEFVPECPFGNTVKDGDVVVPCGWSNDDCEVLLCGQCKTEMQEAANEYEEW